jgi:regulatory protein YycI of two-component signal transduction system YycFG
MFPSGKRKETDLALYLIIFLYVLLILDIGSIIIFFERKKINQESNSRQKRSIVNVNFFEYQIVVSDDSNNRQHRGFQLHQMLNPLGNLVGLPVVLDHFHQQ